MEIKIVAKNIELTQGLKEAVEKKLSRLEKYFGPEVQCTEKKADSRSDYSF